MAGFQNLITVERYPEIDIQDLVELNPKHVLLSSEPYPFKENHLLELKERLPNAN